MYQQIILRLNKLEKMISYVYCKVKNLTNIYNELEGLQGGREGEYYQLSEEQYNCVVENCSDENIGLWVEIPEP